MKNYYCTTHKDEDLTVLIGEPLDACTNHMVKHSGYDLEAISNDPSQVVWLMVRDLSAKFGYRFGEVI